ncbi:MAG: amidoligase family protein [Pseudomonadota bacterium]
MTSETDRLISKLKARYPMLQYFTDRTFGVEIEFFGLQYVAIPTNNGIIKPYNISSRAKDGRHMLDLIKDNKIPIGDDRESWHFEKDRSVRGKGHTKCGAELTSPILSGINGLMQVYRMFQFLSDIAGIDIDKSCGLHVHHGVDPAKYNCAHLQQLVRIVHPFEKQLYLLIPGNREEADTCRPMEINVEAFLDICEAYTETGSCEIKNLWYSTKNRCEEESRNYTRYDKTRYHGLNLHSYWYRSTIEFRYHSAILHNIDEAMQWIVFTQFLVELSQGNAPKIFYFPEANKWMETIYDIYMDLGYENQIKMVAN